MNSNMKKVDWGFFFLDEIFTTIQRGKRLTKNYMIAPQSKP